MFRHIPVLLNEVINGLNLKTNFNMIDCTLGDAGHAEAILEKIGPKGKLLGIDADAEAVLRAKRYLYKFGERAICVRDNFVRLKEIVKENDFGPINGAFMDLGWSSPQFEERGRGFSFLKEEEPLDMRYGKISNFKFQISNKYQNPNFQTDDMTAGELVNTLSIEELTKIFKNYGEEKLSEEIAEAIVEKRKEKRIERVGELVEIILQVYREKLGSTKEVPWVGGLHPATKVFQALRIAVNNELEAVRQALPQAVDVLSSGGRLAVIAFHSLEDRIVKQFFQKEEGKNLRLINKKPIVATDEEVEVNPRARSAKLRIAEKLDIGY